MKNPGRSPDQKKARARAFLFQIAVVAKTTIAIAADETGESGAGLQTGA